MRKLPPGVRITGNTLRFVAAELKQKYEKENCTLEALGEECGRSRNWVASVLKESGVALRGRESPRRQEHFSDEPGIADDQASSNIGETIAAMEPRRRVTGQLR